MSITLTPANAATLPRPLSCEVPYTGSSGASAALTMPASWASSAMNTASAPAAACSIAGRLSCLASKVMGDLPRLKALHSSMKAWRNRRDRLSAPNNSKGLALPSAYIRRATWRASPSTISDKENSLGLAGTSRPIEFKASVGTDTSGATAAMAPRDSGPITTLTPPASA